MDYSISGKINISFNLFQETLIFCILSKMKYYKILGNAIALGAFLVVVVYSCLIKIRKRCFSKHTFNTKEVYPAVSISSDSSEEEEDKHGQSSDKEVKILWKIGRNYSSF